ncbi:hypothetical protein BT96DRAFT_944423 [Gymnopus androsaceus JB14]|uniref:Uncharacterized protein n=1 Tax=Gymnopus androsaceus JB14 TaxID=1447944 RepID=A0A6A4H3F1_9AGAR|nr:hypothetical protein BT96DRAFT_944423 [Gymnopus androsaceus JB14]
MSPSLTVGDSSTFSSGRLALDLREPCNQRFLNTEARLIEIISQMGDRNAERTQVKEAALTGLETIRSVKGKLYKDQLSLQSNRNVVDNRFHWHCYDPLFALQSSALLQNSNCTRVATVWNNVRRKFQPDGPECGADLWKVRCVKGGAFVVPERTQVLQDPKEWLGRLLARPEIEDAMVEYQKRRLIPDREEDFTDSKTFAQFGRSGTVKTAHAVVQSTALYMYLLVLPERMRFQKKNMLLLAVLPGEPKQHLINNILNRVVNLLLPLEEGLHYLQTAKYPFGRNVLLVVVPIDSFTYTHIVLHPLFASQKQYQRDPEQHRIRATEWRDAATQKIRNDIYKKYGVWNMIRNVDNDSDLERFLLSQQKPLLWYLCFYLQLGTAGTKAKHVEALLKWDPQMGPSEVDRSLLDHPKDLISYTELLRQIKLSIFWLTLISGMQIKEVQPKMKKQEIYNPHVDTLALLRYHEYTA